MSRARDLADLGSGKTIASATPSGGLVLIEKKTVAEASSSTTAFDFTDVFSADYNRYYIEYDINRDGDSLAITVFASLSNANTRLTNQAYGGGDFYQVYTNSSGYIRYSSNDGVHQLGGDLDSTGNGYFRGNGYIINPFSTTESTEFIFRHTMSQQPTTADEDSFWQENITSAEAMSSPSKATDVLFGIIVGDSAAGNVTFSNTQKASFGSVAIYGVKGF